MATIKTAAQLRAELKKNGVRLPHGYDVVKRAPAKKKKATTAKAKTAKKKTATKAKRKTTAKQSTAQRKFAANSKRAAKLVKSGKAKNTADAWKQIKMDF